MKIVKYIFFLLLLALIGGSVYIATKDGNYDVAESKVIDAPYELLFTTVNEFKTWEKWGPWMDMSDDMKMNYPEVTSGEGGSYSWTSKTQGDGSMKTTKSVPHTEIDQDITFITPLGESKGEVYWKFEKLDPKKTKVTWGMKGEQTFMEKAFWAFQDSTLVQSMRPMYQKGLQNLDTFVSKKMMEHSVKVEGPTEHGGGFYMYVATASAMEAIPEKMTEMFPLVYTYVQKNNLPQTGVPFTIYNEINEQLGTAIYSTAIPVRDRVITPSDSNVLCDFMPRQQVIKTVLKGDYSYLKEAWEATMKYLEENNLQRAEKGAPFEVYATDPTVQPNPAEWITELYVPYTEVGE